MCLCVLSVSYRAVLYVTLLCVFVCLCVSYADDRVTVCCVVACFFASF